MLLRRPRVNSATRIAFIKKYLASGLTQKEFCQQEKLAYPVGQRPTGLTPLSSPGSESTVLPQAKPPISVPLPQASSRSSLSPAPTCTAAAAGRSAAPLPAHWSFPTACWSISRATSMRNCSPAFCTQPETSHDPAPYASPILSLFPRHRLAQELRWPRRDCDFCSRA